MSWFSNFKSGAKVIKWVLNPTPENMARLAVFILETAVDPKRSLIELVAELILGLDVPDNTILDQVIDKIITKRQPYADFNEDEELKEELKRLKLRRKF